MKNDYEFRKKWCNPLILSFIILFVISCIIWYLILDYNNKEITVQDNNSSKVYVQNDLNSAKGERWTCDLPNINNPEEIKTIKGETINCYIINNNSHDIKNWNLKLFPQNECYLNGFWGGLIEIHQFREGKELVETLGKIVSPSEIKELEINPYCDSMMIRLIPGDYILYYPIEEDVSTRIKANNSLAIVLNIYYQSDLSLSEYQLTYTNDLKINDLWISKIILVLWIILIILTLFYHAVLIVNKRVLRDMKNQDQSIYVMADLYLATYRINLDTQEAFLIKGNPDNPLIMFERNSLQDSLDKFIKKDCFEEYEESAIEFFVLDTLKERLENNTSILYEYQSKSIGWCSVRIFKMLADKNNTQYVLTFQDINDERKKLLLIEENKRQTQDTLALQENFMGNLFFSITDLNNRLLNESQALIDTIADEKAKDAVQNINYGIDNLHLILNYLFDLFAIETNNFHLNSMVYDIHEMSIRIKEMLRPFYEGQAFEFQMDIDSKIPNKLMGDKDRLMQIISSLLVSAMFITKQGYVKFSIFGKNTGDSETLLFSIRDTAHGFSEEQINEINNLLEGSVFKTHENASLVYLQIINQILIKMNSKINIVSVPGSGSEFYFSIEQKVIND